MKNRDKLVKSVISAFLAIAASSPAIAASEPANDNTEKCYGVVKAGMNDCSTATASCSGSSVKDNQPDAFIFMTKGLCEKLTNGSLTAKKGK